MRKLIAVRLFVVTLLLLVLGASGALAADIDYLIITENAFTNEFQRLADHRAANNEWGTEVITVAYIDANYDGTRPDGDGVYFESTTDADYYPDICVGSISVLTDVQAATYVQKVIDYDTNPDVSVLNRVMLGGVNLVQFIRAMLGRQIYLA